MIYTSAIYANPEHTQVTGTDAQGNTETVPRDYTLFRQPDDGPDGFVANGGVIAAFATPVSADLPLALCQIAAARLHVEGFDISGVERSQGVGFAMLLDEHTAWIFFEQPQADTNYVVTPSDGVTKTTDYIEVALAGLTDIALIVQRVQ